MNVRQVRESIGVALSVVCSNKRLFATSGHSCLQEVEGDIDMVELPKKENWVELLTERASDLARNIQSANQSDMIDSMVDLIHENGYTNSNAKTDVKTMETVLHLILFPEIESPCCQLVQLKLIYFLFYCCRCSIS